MRTFILLLIFGSTLATARVASDAITDRDTEVKVSMLSAQTEQAGDVRPKRGGGRRRFAEDMPVSGESFFDASIK